jgi:AmiR/NasT family two-component response regulator
MVVDFTDRERIRVRRMNSEDAFRPLRIVVADDELDMREYFSKILPRLGHQVVAAASNGAELVERCRALHPDLVITDVKMPEMDGIDAATRICQEEAIPVLLVSAYHDPALIQRAETDPIMGYLVKPIKQADLESAVALAMHRFEQFQALRREAVEDRKIIERGKGILMKKASLGEQDAFRRLQKLAGERNLKLVEIARILVTADEALDSV